MLKEKIAVEKVALNLPVKLSINTEGPETTVIYDAQTRLISMKGLLVKISSKQENILREGDNVTCTLSYERKLFYSNCVIIKVKNNEAVLQFSHVEFERLMVLKYIISDS